MTQTPSNDNTSTNNTNNSDTAPEAAKPQPYEILGGEAGVKRLVDLFYDAMESLPEAQEIRAMHDDMPRAREKLYLFLSGWLGGPPLYWQKHGHPRLRMRHMPFAIDEKAAAQWMFCMAYALDAFQETNPLDETFVRNLLAAFAHTAQHMRNQP